MSLFGQDSINPNITSLAKNTEFFEFWSKLNDNGKNLAISTFTSTLLTGFSILLNSLISFRHLSYAMADEYAIGGWYEVYMFSSFFKAKFLSPVVFIFCILTVAFLGGYINIIK